MAVKQSEGQDRSSESEETGRIGKTLDRRSGSFYLNADLLTDDDDDDDENDFSLFVWSTQDELF